MIKLDGTVPVKYGLRMNADDKHSVVKFKLSSLSGIPANNLKLAEIIGAQIKVSYCFLVSTINIQIICYLILFCIIQIYLF